MIEGGWLLMTSLYRGYSIWDPEGGGSRANLRISNGIALRKYRVLVKVSHRLGCPMLAVGQFLVDLGTTSKVPVNPQFLVI